MRALIPSLILAFLVTACQTSPPQPAAKDRTAATPTATVPTVQTVEVRHVVAMPAPLPTAKTPAAQVAAVGQVAPDFTLPAYHQGKFTQVKLSSFRGKWVLVCFYPGDFTFV